ncbi:protein of unknown function [Fictibacillus enclensis]|uniref:DUF1885 domain-containing protein n=1 Tax=Fictibacillus enclensis TaxID=1017270 RepID=A0A0V8JD24_9BACL|nr:DUF1885 family protein [Fictibacillus enclensis]KSU84926.1 hypothetical protein AS030_05215 [Fictibacillus enclensis]SCB87936.1 protein of unknown function [Fictibacillus enclensis]
MQENAYIKLVPASKQQTISIDEVKDLFHYYKDITNKTGSQLGWQYGESAFPYTIEEKSHAKGQWFYLNSNDKMRFRYIMVGVDNEAGSIPYIQVTLPEGFTHGDKGKANEFCKFLAKHLDAELHLFNGRIMYYYKRK